jgi:D-serine deaminase-like pyridoxal phosphate-dependent protein
MPGPAIFAVRYATAYVRNHPIANLMPPFRSPWPAPARPGAGIEQVETPALVLDLDAFERNLARMARFASERGLRLRPHAKMHKTPAVALAQLKLGAVGVCCQKVSEAEAMVDGGVPDVLVSNEVVGDAKLARLAALARRARIGFCVDDATNAAAAGAAASAAGVILDAYVEIDVGAGRCGVAPGRAALALARAVAAHPGLRLAGLQAYHGRAQHMRSPAERAAAIRAASDAARLSRDMMEDAGIPCPVVTGAGTGTFELEGDSGVYNELQPGSYAFMDADYARNTCETPFEYSLFVLAGVMSLGGAAGTRPDRVVVDAGLKAHAVDSGLPLVHSTARGTPVPGLTFRGASDEHGVIEVAAAAAAPRLGDKLRLVPGHIDPTVNLHDWIVCTRSGAVVDVWPVTARGAMW